MSPVIHFSFARNQVRVFVGEANELWFVAQDVSAILQYSHLQEMTRTIDAYEKDLHDLQTPSGKQEIMAITEPGLYSAILNSRSPEAKIFKKWVTSEVLPFIRKIGSYAAKTPIVPGELAPKAEKDEAASMALASVAGKALSLRRKEKRILAQIVGLLREEVQLKLTLASIDGGVK